MKQQKGFTLIELLIVIGIITIISSMLLPNFNLAQDKAKESAVRSIVHVIQTSVESYALDHSSYPDGNDLPLATLYSSLSSEGYLTSLPKNPFTGAEYNASDCEGKIIYDYDSSTGEYQITAFKRDGSTELISISNS